MSKHRNCPNCAAPYDVHLNKCPYCGTYYFDLSVIDFDSHEPFFLKIKTNGVYITQLVKPTCSEILMSHDTTYFLDGEYWCEKPVHSVVKNMEVATHIEFTTVAQANGAIMEVEKIDD